MEAPIRIATISSRPDPDWIWIGDRMEDGFSVAGRPLEWRSYSIASKINWLPQFADKAARRLPSLSRFFGARKLATAHRRQPFDMIVSHGPWATAWTEPQLGGARKNVFHLAYSFNFTDLPRGARKALMARAFRSVDAFAVFTKAEQQLYADYFSLPSEKMLIAPWGVAAPLITPGPRQFAGDYFAALGGEARDYETLCEAARLCPDIEFVAVARPHNFAGLTPPANLTVRFNLPFEEAWSIVCHANAALIPLRSRDTPCGIVSMIGAMHMGKAQIVTDAAGIGDYFAADKFGLLVAEKDPAALARAVRRLQADPPLAAGMGAAARDYARSHCGEDATTRFFAALLDRQFG